MIGHSALAPVFGALTNVLTAPGSFTSALCPVFNDVPQGTLPPYLVLESPVELPWNTFGEFGKDCTVNLHSVSQAFGDLENFSIIDAVVSDLEYATPIVAKPHRIAFTQYIGGHGWHEEAVNGVKTRHFMAVLKLWVAQDS